MKIQRVDIIYYLIDSYGRIEFVILHAVILCNLMDMFFRLLRYLHIHYFSLTADESSHKVKVPNVSDSSLNINDTVDNKTKDKRKHLVLKTIRTHFRSANMLCMEIH